MHFITIPVPHIFSCSSLEEHGDFITNDPNATALTLLVLVKPG
jgi:hypothetical protein